MSPDQQLATPNQIIPLLLKLIYRHRVRLLDLVFDILQRTPLLPSLPGMYEVLEHAATLELQSGSGRKVTYKKRQKVRFLQDNIIAYQDKAWGDGNIFADHQCSPGVAVDRYREGHRYRILISLRETKHRDDVEEFQIRREITDGFTQAMETFQTEIDHRTRHLRLQLIFPASRPPQSVSVIEQNGQRTIALDGQHRQTLPDKRIRYRWETNHPRLFEAYILRWEW